MRDGTTTRDLMIKFKHVATLAVVLITFILPLSALAEMIHCTECGMMVDINSKYAARIVHGDTTLYFCDIGDMFSYLRRNKTGNTKMEVKDNMTGDWIDAVKAHYVRDEKKFRTPMGWGVAAFQDAKAAAEFGSPSDFSATDKSLQ